MEDIWANFPMEYRAKNILWRGDFNFFKDKSAAINPDTGVNSKLTRMIKRWWRRGQKIAGISCLYDEFVMEAQEGGHPDEPRIKNAYMNRYGFDVKPEIKNTPALRRAGSGIEDISSIRTENWDLLKLSTALMIICYPGEKVIKCNPQEMFSADELSKLEADAHKYGWALKGSCSRIYKEIVFAHKRRIKQQKQLGFLIEKARKVYEAEQVELLTMQK
uniref:Uncharacterized protein n=1 Tax=Leersia perrieri TaxID=77586 RepID=A0A0D9VGR6_9ORYZ